MLKRKNVAKMAVAAGIGAILSLVPAAPAWADPGAANTPVEGESANPEYEAQLRGESTGDTKLYVIGSQDDLTTSEGSVTSYRFVGWNTAADGSGTSVSTIGDLGTASELAGTVQEVYAIYAVA